MKKGARSSGSFSSGASKGRAFTPKEMTEIKATGKFFEESLKPKGPKYLNGMNETFTKYSKPYKDFPPVKAQGKPTTPSDVADYLQGIIKQNN